MKVQWFNHAYTIFIYLEFSIVEILLEVCSFSKIQWKYSAGIKHIVQFIRKCEWPFFSDNKKENLNILAKDLFDWLIPKFLREKGPNNVMTVTSLIAFNLKCKMKQVDVLQRGTNRLLAGNHSLCLPIKQNTI